MNGGWVDGLYLLSDGRSKHESFRLSICQMRVLENAKSVSHSKMRQ